MLTPWAVWGHPQLSGRDVATFWSPMVPVSGLLRVYSHHNPVLFTPPPGFVHTYFYFSCCEHVEGGGVNRGVLTARSSAGEGGAHVVDAVSALDGRRTMPWSRMASTGAYRSRNGPNRGPFVHSAHACQTMRLRRARRKGSRPARHRPRVPQCTAREQYGAPQIVKTVPRECQVV